MPNGGFTMRNTRHVPTSAAFEAQLLHGGQPDGDFVLTTIMYYTKNITTQRSGRMNRAKGLHHVGL